MAIQCYQFAHHSLYIRDPEASLDFYQRVIGMTLVRREKNGDREYLFFGFDTLMREEYPAVCKPPHCLLQLIYDPQQVFDNRDNPDSSPNGYWKIAIAVADLKIAHAKLSQQGVRVNDPFMVPDVAYLCHCEDPDGYCIELIQHRFEKNHQPLKEDQRYALGTPTSFSLITLRTRDPQASINFYENVLGLRLVSKQIVEHRGFTLYFFSSNSENPPSSNIEDIEMREWLWQRPYALLELQHVWGTEEDPDFAYETGSDTGFKSFSLLSKNLATTIHGRTDHAMFGCPSMLLKDPDGYAVEVLKI